MLFPKTECKNPAGHYPAGNSSKVFRLKQAERERASEQQKWKQTGLHQHQALRGWQYKPAKPALPATAQRRKAGHG
jgi:hypothetical protein